MLRSIDDAVPTVADTAFVSEQAYLIGNVSIGDRASIWPFVCLRGDPGTSGSDDEWRGVQIGDETNVQEFSMLHGSTIGDRVTIGHGATIDHATVEDESLVGISAVILGGATVESESLVAAGSVVLEDQTVPRGHLAYGTPAVTKPLDDGQIGRLVRTSQLYVERGQAYKQVGGLE